MEESAELKEIATQIRMDVIRMLTKAESGHPGGSLSAADIVTALLFRVMKHDPKRPDWPDRDRFVLSKGHAIPVWYSALAHAGYFPREELMTLRATGSRLQGHPDRNMLSCVEACTGSLGQGLSMALGMAIASRMNHSSFRVYCLMGDGESQEGQVWEAAMYAGHHKLTGLIGLIDYNKVQLAASVQDTIDLEPLALKWNAFGWQALECNGHDIADVVKTIEEARQRSRSGPVIVIAHTVKGKGVSYMENRLEWHGKAPKGEEISLALKELDDALKRLESEKVRKLGG